jgi:hypothetical protein
MLTFADFALWRSRRRASNAVIIFSIDAWVSVAAAAVLSGGPDPGQGVPGELLFHTPPMCELGVGKGRVPVEPPRLVLSTVSI